MPVFPRTLRRGAVLSTEVSDGVFVDSAKGAASFRLTEAPTIYTVGDKLFIRHKSPVAATAYYKVVPFSQGAFTYADVGTSNSIAVSAGSEATTEITGLPEDLALTVLIYFNRTSDNVKSPIYVGHVSLPVPNVVIEPPDPALDIITAVETADGQALETSVRDALNALIRGCEEDESAVPGRSNWEALASGVWRICGARTLAGSLKCGSGTDPTNNNFVSGDYDRLGWKGNGTTKTLNTNRNNNADGQNDQTLAVWAITPNTLDSSRAYIGCGLNETGTSHIASTASSELAARSRNSSANFPIGESSAAGLIGTSRSSSANYVLSSDGVETTITQVSETPLNQNIFVFARENGTPSGNGRYGFYCVCPALNLTLLRQRLATYFAALRAAVTLSQSVFIFAGESNAVGIADNADLTADELDPNPDIQILNNTSLSFEPLDIGTNNVIGQNLLTGLDTRHGWEAGIQQHLLAETGEQYCRLIKTAQSGSTLSMWDDDIDAFWISLVQRINAYKAVAGSQDTVRVWFSFGINDAIVGTNTTTWRTGTESWIARIRTLVGDPNLKFYATKLMSNSAAKDAINVQLEAIAAADPNFFLLDTSNTTTYPLRDGDENHWNASSMKLIAQQFLQMEWA